jgi:hypothetical protein
MPKTGTKKALISRVKRAVRKSRRKLGDEKFEKELERIIGFLEKIQTKLKPKPKPKPTRKTTKPRKSGAPKAAAARQQRPKPQRESLPQSQGQSCSRSETGAFIYASLIPRLYKRLRLCIRASSP